MVYDVLNESAANRGNITLRSIPPKNFASLPKLAAPAGYICVIRDIDSDRYRLESCNQPGPFIATLFSEQERSFGLELVSVLETGDLAASEAELYDLYQARLDSDWLDLDSYQIEGLRQSILQIDAHRSHYLVPQQPLQAKPRAQPKAVPQSTSPASALQQDPREMPRHLRRQRFRRSPTLYKQYGSRSLRQNRVRSQLQERREANRPVPVRQKLSEAIDKAMINHPWLVLLILALLVLFGISLYDPRYGPYGY